MELDLAPVEVEVEIEAPVVEFEVEAVQPDLEVELEVQEPVLEIHTDLNAPVIEVEAGGATYVQTSKGCSACCLAIWGIVMYLAAAGLYLGGFLMVYNEYKRTGVEPTSLPIAVTIMYLVGGCFGLTGLILLIASCVKCCCLNTAQTVVYQSNGIDIEVGGAPVQDATVEIEMGSDCNYVAGMDVDIGKTDVEFEVEIDVPEVEVEIDVAADVSIEAPDIEVEIEAEAEFEVEVEIEAPELEVEVEIEAPEVEVEIEADVEVEVEVEAEVEVEVEL